MRVRKKQRQRRGMKPKALIYVVYLLCVTCMTKKELYV